MNADEIRASIDELRARRSSIPELRDYRPQSKKRSTDMDASKGKSAEEIFSGLFEEAPPAE